MKIILWKGPEMVNEMCGQHFHSTVKKSYGSCLQQTAEILLLWKDLKWWMKCVANICIEPLKRVLAAVFSKLAEILLRKGQKLVDEIMWPTLWSIPCKQSWYLLANGEGRKIVCAILALSQLGFVMVATFNNWQKRLLLKKTIMHERWNTSYVNIIASHPWRVQW